MGDFRIRLAEAADIEAVRIVIDAAYAPWRARLDGIPDMSESLDEDIAGGVCWIAHSNDKIVGVLIGFAQEGGLNILNLAVDPDASGTGVGSALLSVAETFVRTEGGLELRVTTHADMEPTLAFYAARGWTEIDRDGVRVFLLRDLTED